MMATSLRSALAGFCLTLIILGLAEFTNLDLLVQGLLYDPDRGQWLLGSGEPVTRFFLYDGIKAVLIAFALALLFIAIAGGRFAVSRSFRRRAALVVISLITVPLVVGALKTLTHVACPRHLLVFGGTAEYIGIFRSMFDSVAATQAFRCFPAGHASGGFALLSLVFLFDGRRARRTAVIFALTVGSVMAAYKMLIGDHFLSHSLISLTLAWTLISIVKMLDELLQSSMLDRHRSTRSSKYVLSDDAAG